MNGPAPTTSTVDIGASLAAFVTGFDLASVPDAIVERAKLSILDGLGIGLAAVHYPFATRLMTALSALGGSGDFPVIGSSLRLGQRDAAHLNGTLIHGLDFDDTHTESVVHTAASAIPTMLTAGLASAANGARALSAFIIASECASRIGAAARGGFHERGFHPTGVVGAFGATLAAGYLYGLDHAELIDAQGIVLSQAGGSLQFLDDGADTKRNHPGWASVCGQTAAVMARHGYTGPRDPYRGRFGLYALYTNDARQVNTDAVTHGLGRDWQIAHVAFKPYPACHMTHAFADAALKLRAEHGFGIDDIESITARVHPGEIPVICEPAAIKIAPRNAYDAQFSVYYVIAAALMRGRFGLTELEDATLADASIRRLASKVTYTPDPDSAYPDFYSGAVDVTLRDGRCLHHREQHNRGSAANPMAAEEIIEKFLNNATQTLSQRRAEAIIDLVFSLESHPDLRALSEALRMP